MNSHHVKMLLWLVKVGNCEGKVVGFGVGFKEGCNVGIVEGCFVGDKLALQSKEQFSCTSRNVDPFVSLQIKDDLGKYSPLKFEIK